MSYPAVVAFIAFHSHILTNAHLSYCANNTLTLSCFERLLNGFRRYHNFISMNRALLVSIAFSQQILDVLFDAADAAPPS
jgi:hypothetical protein